MERRPSRRTALLAGALLALGSTAGHPQQGGSPARSVLEGVYAAAQASRGETVFQMHCAACHSAAQFTGPVFLVVWEGTSVYDLFELIRSTMPYDKGGSLPRASYADVVAYLLRLNGFPAGPRELPDDSTALRQLKIESRIP